MELKNPLIELRQQLQAIQSQAVGRNQIISFKKNTIFSREPAEKKEDEVFHGGVLAVWGSPGSGKTTVAVKLAKHLADKKKNVVFVLWGAFAQKKASLIDSNKHHIIQSAHPSPFSVYRGFFGSKPFSKINNYLLEKGKKPIVWG